MLGRRPKGSGIEPSASSRLMERDLPDALKQPAHLPSPSDSEEGGAGSRGAEGGSGGRGPSALRRPPELSQGAVAPALGSEPPTEPTSPATVVSPAGRKLVLPPLQQLQELPSHQAEEEGAGRGGADGGRHGKGLFDPHFWAKPAVVNAEHSLGLKPPLVLPHMG